MNIIDTPIQPISLFLRSSSYSQALNTTKTNLIFDYVLISNPTTPTTVVRPDRVRPQTGTPTPAPRREPPRSRSSDCAAAGRATSTPRHPRYLPPAG